MTESESIGGHREANGGLTHAPSQRAELAVGQVTLTGAVESSQRRRAPADPLSYADGRGPKTAPHRGPFSMSGPHPPPRLDG